MPTICGALLAPYLYIGIYMPAILPHMVNKKKQTDLRLERRKLHVKTKHELFIDYEMYMTRFYKYMFILLGI